MDAIILFIVWCLSSLKCINGGESSPVCEYEILGLDKIITVSSNTDIGDSVFTLVIQEISPTVTTTTTVRPVFSERRKRAGPEVFIAGEHDIILDKESSNFGVVFSSADNYHEVTVLSCLKPGDTETLEFVFNEALDDGACDIARLTINVEPTVPEFGIDSSDDILVDVNTCLPGVILDVLLVDLDNDADCLSVNCFINIMNDVKAFWVDEGPVIQTSTDDIDFNKTYELLLTCFDSGAPSLGRNQIAHKVTFKQTGMCTATLTSTAVPETTTRGYFDTPANVAVIAAIAGVVLGAAAGVGLYLMMKRFCVKKIIPVGGRKRENQDEDKEQPNEK